MPDLIGRGVVVRGPVGGVAVLVGVEVSVGVSGDDLANPPDSAVRSGFAWGKDELGTVSPEDALPFV